MIRDFCKKPVTICLLPTLISLLIGLFSDFDKVYAKAKPDFTVIPYKVGDKVQLLVEEERYSRFGIHKGSIGCVVDDAVVAGKVEVDFYEPKEAAAYDSTLAVKITDLKVL